MKLGVHEMRWLKKLTKVVRLIAALLRVCTPLLEDPDSVDLKIDEKEAT